MSVDSKQFNRTVLTYEEVEQQIRHARRLRSEAMGRALGHLGAVIGAGSRSLRARISGALHHKKGDNRSGTPWLPASSAGGRPVRCK